MPVASPDSSTPPAKKIARLTDSRDAWKAKYKQLMVRVRVLENNARWLEKSRDTWQAKAAAAQQSGMELKKSQS